MRPPRKDLPKLNVPPWVIDNLPYIVVAIFVIFLLTVFMCSRVEAMDESPATKYNKHTTPKALEQRELNPIKPLKIEPNLSFKLMIGDHLRRTVKNPKSLKIISWGKMTEYAGIKVDGMVCEYTYTYRNTFVRKKTMFTLWHNVLTPVDLEVITIKDLVTKQI